MRFKRGKRRGKPIPISQTLTSEVRKLGRGHRGIHPEIWARWTEIVGVELGRRVFPRRLYRRQLVVAVCSSAWMQELVYLKSTLIEKIAEEVGPDVVDDLKFTLDTTVPARPPSSATRPPEPPPPTASRPCPPQIDAAVASVEDDELKQTIRRAVQANLKR